MIESGQLLGVGRVQDDAGRTEADSHSRHPSGCGGMCTVTRLDLLTAGEAMAVATPDPPRPLREGPRLALGVAGAEANVASYLARLGHSVGFVGRIGADPFGGLISDFLTAAGVSCYLSVLEDFPTGVYFKDPAPAGTNVHYYRAGSAASTMDASVWSAGFSAPDRPPERHNARPVGLVCLVRQRGAGIPAGPRGADELRRELPRPALARLDRRPGAATSGGSGRSRVRRARRG